MAQKNTLEIIVKATTDQAQAAFKKLDASISTATGDVRKSLLNFSTATQGVGKGFEALTGLSVGAAAGMLGVGAAVSKASQFLKDSIATTAEYGRTVYEMSLKIGASAEETSRLIQVADDYKISVGEMEAAMRIALRNGFQPSIENLAQLADRIKGITDPTQRAAELTKIFGRNWQALLPMLLDGGEAIRSNAAAISDSLIMTDENIQATEEYRLALDALNDSVEGVKLQIGKQLVPALGSVLGAFTDGATKAEQFRKIWKDVGETFRDTGKLTQSFAKETNALKTAIEGGFFFNTAGLADLVDKINAIEDPLKRVAEAERVFGKHWVDIMPIIDKGGDYIRALGGAMSDIPDDMAEMVRSSVKVSSALEDMQAKAEQSQSSIDAFSKALSKSDVGWSEQVKMIQEFAAELGIADTSALTFATDMEFINQALTAGVIGWDEYRQILIDAQDGMINLTDAQRQSIDAQLQTAEAAGASAAANKKAADSTKGYTDTLDEFISKQNEANQAARDAAAAYSDMAVSLKDAKLAEVAAQSLDILKAALDAGTISSEQFTTMSQDIGLAFGLMDQKSIALTDNLTKFQQVLALIPATQADEFLKALYMDARDGVSNFESIAEKFGITAEQLAAVLKSGKEVVNLLPSMQEAFDMTSESMTGVAGAAEDMTTSATIARGAIEDMGLAAARRYATLGALATAETNVGKQAEAAKTRVDNLKKAIDALKSKNVAINISGNFATVLGALQQISGFRQHGGPVAPGQSYIVGEQGPELFVPRNAGDIVPNNQLPMPYMPGQKSIGGSTTNSNVTIQNTFPIQRAEDRFDMRALARMVAAEMARSQAR